MKKRWSDNQYRMRRAPFLVVAFLLLFINAGCVSHRGGFDSATKEPQERITPTVMTITPPEGTTYQPPQTGWIAVTEAVVRTWPKASYPPVAILTRGQEVRIAEVSLDGLWMHIDQPVAGWIPVAQLRFEEKGRALLLTPTVFRLYLWVKAKPRLRVRASPDADSEIVTHVMYGEMVEIDNLTNDKQWAHIIAPTEGWISKRYLSSTPVKSDEK